MDRWVVHSVISYFYCRGIPASSGLHARLAVQLPLLSQFTTLIFFFIEGGQYLSYLYVLGFFFPLDPASSLRDSSVTVAFFLKLVYFKRKGKKRRKDNGIAKWLPGHVTDSSPTLYSVIKPDVFNIYYHSDCLSSAPASPLKSSMTVYGLVHLTLLGHNTISAVGTPQWVFQNHSEECTQSSWRDARHIVIDGFPCSIWMEIKNR